MKPVRIAAARGDRHGNRDGSAGGTASDRRGRMVTTSLAEYVVAVNADVRDVDVLFVGGRMP